MKNIACVIAYDGSRFSNFSRQGQSLSVQGQFEKALKSVGIFEKIKTASRTDKGVHATHQVVSFVVKIPIDTKKLGYILNLKLNPDITVRRVFTTPDNFHPRFDAKLRFYRYVFTDCDNLLPFYRRYISVIKYGELELIQRALNEFVGTHDFSLFKKNGSITKSNVRNIVRAKIYQKQIHGIGCHVINIGANGFLRSQVRIIVKNVIECSMGRSLDLLQRQIENNLEAKHCIKEPAPPNGLYLSRIIY